MFKVIRGSYNLWRSRMASEDACYQGIVWLSNTRWCLLALQGTGALSLGESAFPYLTISSFATVVRLWQLNIYDCTGSGDPGYVQWLSWKSAGIRLDQDCWSSVFDLDQRGGIDQALDQLLISVVLISVSWSFCLIKNVTVFWLPDEVFWYNLSRI